MSCGLVCTSHGIHVFTLRYLLRIPPGPMRSVELKSAPGYLGSASMKLPVWMNVPCSLQKRS
jgi:hypothetical protein